MQGVRLAWTVLATRERRSDLLPQPRAAAAATGCDSPGADQRSTYRRIGAPIGWLAVALLSGAGGLIPAAATRPRKVPAIGQVLDLRPGDVRYRRASLKLQVSSVRADISGWYGGEWVWLEGYELDPAGYRIGWQQVLVAVAAIERQTGGGPD
jgi:hypothetical protein